MSPSPSTTDPSVRVSWEIAKYLVDDASKGDHYAVLTIIKLACPEWTNVKLEDFSVEMLGGGFSGNVPYKCSAKDIDGSLAFKVIPPEGEGGEETMCDTAYRLWSNAGIVPEVYLLNNSAAPGVEIYEFIEGKNASWLATKHGAEFLENEEDAACFGKLVGRIHSLPSGWYEKFKNDPKPQWESWQEGSKTNKLACEMRDKYGDYAATTVLFVENFKHRGKNMEAIGKQCIAMWPLLQAQLTTEVMSRIRVCHGDLHGGNLLHRKADGHGDLVAIDLDFVGYNPAVLDLAVGLGSQMCGPYGYYFLQGEPQGEYPSLQTRRLVVANYLESLADAKSFSQIQVDDIVYDIEVGGMLRILWAAPIFAILGLNKAPHQLGWAFVHYSRAALNIFEQCKTDAAMKKQVLELGIAKVYTDRLLEIGMKPMQLTREQYKEQWDLFGKLGPAFVGPFPEDDPEAGEEDKKKVEPEPTDHISSFQAAAFRFFEDSGDNLKGLFAKFDTNGSGTIDFNEFLGAAVMCGVGYKSMAEAKEAFEALDVDHDEEITFEEFKNFIHTV